MGLGRRMSIITRMRKQTAVYWALASNESGGIAYDDYGRPQHTDPVEVTCRWEGVNEEFLDSQGARQMSRAIVYVPQDMVEGEILMLGELTDITDETNLKENDNAWEIRRFDKLPTLRATEYLRTCYL